MNYNVTTGNVRKSIKEIEGARQKLVDKIQATALQCIWHAHTHGDVTLCIELAKAVGNGMKHESLRLYFSKYGPCDPDSKSILRHNKGKVVKPEDLDAHLAVAATEMWHESDTEKKADDFELGTLVAALLRKVTKASESGYTPTEDEKEAIDMLTKASNKVPPKPKAPKVQAAA